jgi:hypothetical protein
MRFAAGTVAAIGAALLLLAVLQDALQVIHTDHTRRLSVALGAIGLCCLCVGMRVCYQLERAGETSTRGESVSSHS